MKLGRAIIEALKKAFGLELEASELNCQILEDLFETIAREFDWNYCPDCDERIPDEPLRNEGYD